MTTAGVFDMPGDKQIREDVETLLGKSARKPLAIIGLIAGTVIVTATGMFVGIHEINELVDTKIRAAYASDDFKARVVSTVRADYAAEATKALTDHKAYEKTLEVHDREIGDLQKSNNEVLRQLEGIAKDIGFIKDNLPSRQR